jgi:hypothetical protein
LGRFGTKSRQEAADEVAGVAGLENCRSVRQVMERNKAWWRAEEGNGRVMEFDLSPQSPSWQTLISRSWACRFEVLGALDASQQAQQLAAGSGLAP